MWITCDALVMWNNRNVLCSLNIIQHNKTFSFIASNLLLYLFRTHARSLYGIETWFLKMHKKDLNNMSVVYHMATERICGRNFYDSKHDCLKFARLSSFKHFLARNFVCFAQRLLTSKSQILVIHRHYLWCDSISEIILKDSLVKTIK